MVEAGANVAVEIEVKVVVFKHFAGNGGYRY
jgi:hypothetical protein